MKRLVFDYDLQIEDENRIQELAKVCNLHELTTKILYARSIDTKEKIENFLNPSSSHFIDPFLMTGMSTLKEKIDTVKAKGGKIVVFGDYDADGIGAASILYLALKEYDANVIAFIPERSEGYGLNITSLDKLFQYEKPDLIITVDCGISNKDEVAYVKAHGVDIVVTDHHELPDILPDCVIVNPKYCKYYPYNNLAGAGVAFKVACAILGEKAYQFLDIATISTVADSVSLIGENRDIVFEGLKRINARTRLSIAQLLQGKKEEITVQTLAFNVAPRINAAGRMGNANCALQLLTETDASKIEEISQNLVDYNVQRQQLCEEVYKSVKEKIMQSGGTESVIMLYDENWNSGLVGIVAARIADEFNRPTILFVKNGEKLKGSARTIESIGVYNALKSTAHLIEEFGGHAHAAGVNIKEENFEPLKAVLNKYFAEHYSKEAFVPTISVCELNYNLTPAIVKELERLEPCGVGNKKPLFAIDAKNLQVQTLKEGSPHLLIKAKKLEMLWFSAQQYMPILQADVPKKIIFECNISKFKHVESIRGIVRELICEGQGGKIAELYFFQNQLKSILLEEERLSIHFCKTEEILANMKEREKAGENYGMLFVSNKRPPKEFQTALKDLTVNIFQLSSKVADDTLLIAPQDGLNLSIFKDIICLESAISYQFASTFPKQIMVNTDICGYEELKNMDTSRENMCKLYKELSSFNALIGEDSVAIAKQLQQDEDKQRELVFAIEVFLELGIFTKQGNYLRTTKGEKTELQNSKIYNRIISLQEKLLLGA